MVDPFLQALAAAKDPAEKAALIAEAVLEDLPAEVVRVTRGSVILHWFDLEIIAALLPGENKAIAQAVYKQLVALLDKCVHSIFKIPGSDITCSRSGNMETFDLLFQIFNLFNDRCHRLTLHVRLSSIVFTHRQ